MKYKNPLIGKVGFNRKCRLWIDKEVLFGDQFNPKVTTREWFFLLLDASLSDGEGYGIDVEKLKKEWLGSVATQWRTKMSLLKKGYISKWRQTLRRRGLETLAKSDNKNFK